MLSRRSFLKFSVLGFSSLIWGACKAGSTRTSGEAVAGLQSPLTPTPLPGGIQLPDCTSYQVLLDNLDFPEGPAFDINENLWCTEMGAGNLIEWNTDQAIRRPVNGRPNGLKIDRAGIVWFTDSMNNSIRRFNPKGEKWETITNQVSNELLQTPNDLTFDTHGNLLFTCPNFKDNAPTGYVCCLSPDMIVKIIAAEMYRPNGIALFESEKYLVIADTFTKQLYRGSWDASRLELKDLIPWVYVGGEEGPDGLTCSKDGLLFCAVFGESIIKVVTPSGDILMTCQLPGRNPTNIALDPTGKLGLVVTESDLGMLISFPNIMQLPANL